MKAGGIVNRRAKWLVLLGGVSLAAALATGVFQTDLQHFESAGSDAFSTSALGHRAFVELLRGIGVPTVVSTYASAAKAGSSGLLVIAEPRFLSDSTLDSRRLRMACDQVPRTAVVLPKRAGSARADRSDWLAATRMLPATIAENALDALGIEGTVVRTRVDEGLAWYGPYSRYRPRVDTVQLFTADGLQVLLACPHGVLAAEIHDPETEGRILIVSDPDLIANHGLADGDNAKLAIALLAGMGLGEGGVVFDETFHGYVLRRSLWRSFFEYPLVLTLISVLLTSIALASMAVTRFGKPLPPRRRGEWGKGYLIENTADLLCGAGHHAYVAREYVDDTIRGAARQLNLPYHRSITETVAAAQREAARKGCSTNIIELRETVQALGAGAHPDEGELIRAAQRAGAWRKEVVYGA